MAEVATGVDRGSRGRYAMVLLLVAAVVLAGRLLVGPFVGLPVHPITLLAMVAGLVAMVAVVELSTVLYGHTAPWSRLWESAVGRGDPWDYRWGGTQLQLLVGVVGGGLYPWTFSRGLALPGSTWAAFPTSVGTGLLWGGALFVVAGVAYLATGTLRVSQEGARGLGESALLFVVYGIVFGLLVGLWHPLLFG